MANTFRDILALACRRAGLGAPRGFSIRARLMALVALAMIPFIAWVVLAVGQQRDRDRESQLTAAREHARDIARHIDGQIGHIDGVLQTLSIALSDRPDNLGHNEDLLAASRANLGAYIAEIKAYLPDGRSLGSSTRQHETDSAHPDHLATIMAHTGLTFDQPALSATTGRWSLDIGRPLLAGGKPAGIVCVTLDLLKLGEQLTPDSNSPLARVPGGTVVSALSRDRIVVARSTEAEKNVGQPLAETATHERILAAAEGSVDFVNVNRQRRLGGWATCARAPWVIFARVNYKNAFAETDARLRSALLWSCLALSLGLGLAWLVSSRITQPIRQLTADAAAVDEPRFTAVKSYSEIGVLAQAYNDMVVRLQQRDAALRRRADELQMLFDLLPVGVAIAVDATGRDIRVNPALGRMFGVPPGKNASLTAPADEAPTSYRVLRDGREIVPHELPIQRAMAENIAITDFEHTILRADGTSVDAVLNAVPLRDEAGRVRGCLAILLDVTARKQIERDRMRFERKLLETQKLESLGVLAGGIAHDFNNILTAILGNASLASLDLAEDSPTQENLLRIREGSMRAADLCRQMLAYSGKGHFVVTKLDLNNVVEGTTELLKISISKRARLKFDLQPRLPPIEGDITQIRQIIMNLVINASEAIGEKDGVVGIATGVTHVDRACLATMLHAPDLPEGPYVSLEISDDGCGMSPETQARIFDPFFTTKFAGRGLGLAAVLGIVRGHQGALKVHSEAGRGTTFQLLFPAVAGAADPIAKPGPAATIGRNSGCVLVVDDEEGVRATAASSLRKMGFAVELATDGREAADLFARDPGRYDLVLMDLTMPRLDGVQTLTELRRLRPQVPVVLMSGFNKQEAVARFTGQGLASFLQKPFSHDELGAALRQALGTTESAG